MADITSSDFQQLIESQKETSRLIEMNTRQLMTSEERLEDDRKKAMYLLNKADKEHKKKNRK